MLVRSMPYNRLQELHNRFQPQFLPNLKTSRAPVVGKQPLPTLDDEFWQTAQAHIYAGSLPPVLDENICKPMDPIPSAQQRMIINHARNMWAPTIPTTSRLPMYHIDWECCHQVERGNATFTRIPVIALHPQHYQEGNRIIRPT